MSVVGRLVVKRGGSDGVARLTEPDIGFGARLVEFGSVRIIQVCVKCGSSSHQNKGQVQVKYAPSACQVRVLVKYAPSAGQVRVGCESSMGQVRVGCESSTGKVRLKYGTRVG